jgi:hypothetical protein
MAVVSFPPGYGYPPGYDPTRPQGQNPYSYGPMPPGFQQEYPGMAPIAGVRNFGPGTAAEVGANMGIAAPSAPTAPIFDPWSVPSYATSMAAAQAGLQQQLDAAKYWLGQVAPTLRQKQAEENQSYGVNRQNTMENLAERGVLGGPQRTLGGRLATQHRFSLQDMATAAAQQQEQIREQQAQARVGYDQSSANALQAAQAAWMQNPSAFQHAGTKPTSNRVNAAMEALRTLESGGNYGAMNSGSGAAGAYQFIPSTWNDFGGYSSAAQAPPSVQDQRARQDVMGFLNRYGPAGVAGMWYDPSVYLSGNLNVVPPGNQVSMNDYISRFMNLYNQYYQPAGPSYQPSYRPPSGGGGGGGGGGQSQGGGKMRVM